MLGRQAMARVQRRSSTDVDVVDLHVAGKTEGRRRAPGPGGATFAFASIFRLARNRAGTSLMDIFSMTHGSAALVSAGTVALAEIGDKTQLLALMLAARFRKPWPIIAGMLVATLLNHAIAGWLGTLFAHSLTPHVLRWVVAGSFLAIALWTLKPDNIESDVLGDTSTAARHGAFVTTAIMFFMAEIGDKTQVATALLAANYSPLWQVIVGTTFGMLLANVPVIVLGSRFADRLPLRAARITATLLFLGLGLWTLYGMF